MSKESDRKASRRKVFEKARKVRKNNTPKNMRRGFKITQRIRDNPQNGRTLPRVGFIVTHYWDSLPVRFRVAVYAFLEMRSQDRL